MTSSPYRALLVDLDGTLLDRRGEIRHRHIGFGPGTETRLRQQVAELLAELE